MASSLPALSSTPPPFSSFFSHLCLLVSCSPRTFTYLDSLCFSFAFYWIRCRDLSHLISCVLDKTAGLPKRVPTGIEIEFKKKKKKKSHDLVSMTSANLGGRRLFRTLFSGTPWRTKASWSHECASNGRNRYPSLCHIPSSVGGPTVPSNYSAPMQVASKR